MDAVIAVTEMGVLLFVWDVRMMRVRGCDGDDNTGVDAGGGVVAVSGV